MPGKSHGQRSLEGHSPQGQKTSDTHTHTYTGRRKAKTNRRKKSQKTPENSEEHGLCRSQGRREFSEGKANTVQTVKRSRKLERTKFIGYDPWEVTGDFQKVQKSHFSN